MTQFQTEIKQLREEVVKMYELVHSQLLKGLSSLLNFDKDLAREVVMIEKRVNGAELQIEKDCENILAIYSPVAVDLRFILAVLKINTNLERIGDIAEGIAKLIIDTETPFKQALLDQTKVIEMYGEAVLVVEEIQTAFEQENTATARGIFKRDEFLDAINRKANDLLSSYLREHPEDLHQALNILSIIRRLERVGDQAENISEEIIFYLEAKVIKHAKRKEKE
ncbi:phosphate signaling complex protein PhoU [Segetibacter koreensis]|jgi:phosphate transport system protein|uniref:phosphate signaling complex protein PhoU n=1 Tax=Segetibacter koreensis TaxID=398037 RepID=UPI0003616A15|nr:phosphate signaling complex protein PhoU [Segetibacter koreensis]